MGVTAVESWVVDDDGGGEVEGARTGGKDLLRRRRRRRCGGSGGVGDGRRGREGDEGTVVGVRMDTAHEKLGAREKERDDDASFLPFVFFI